MIVWYNNKRYAANTTWSPSLLCHIVSVDDTVVHYKTVFCSKLDTIPPTDYWERRDNKLGLQTGGQ